MALVHCRNDGICLSCPLMTHAGIGPLEPGYVHSRKGTRSKSDQREFAGPCVMMTTMMALVSYSVTDVCDNVTMR